MLLPRPELIKEAAVFPNDAGKQTSGDYAGAFMDCAEKYSHKLTQVNTKLKPRIDADGHAFLFTEKQRQ
jgi:hypothetical protein